MGMYKKMDLIDVDEPLEDLEMVYCDVQKKDIMLQVNYPAAS